MVARRPGARLCAAAPQPLALPQKGLDTVRNGRGFGKRSGAPARRICPCACGKPRGAQEARRRVHCVGLGPQRVRLGIEKCLEEGRGQGGSEAVRTGRPESPRTNRRTVNTWTCSLASTFTYPHATQKSIVFGVGLHSAGSQHCALVPQLLIGSLQRIG